MKCFLSFHFLKIIPVFVFCDLLFLILLLMPQKGSGPINVVFARHFLILFNFTKLPQTILERSTRWYLLGNRTLGQSHVPDNLFHVKQMLVCLLKFASTVLESSVWQFCSA